MRNVTPWEKDIDTEAWTEKLYAEKMEGKKLDLEIKKDHIDEPPGWHCLWPKKEYDFSECLEILEKSL